MDANELNRPPSPNPFEPSECTVVEAVPEIANDEPPAPRTRRIGLPVALFFITCLSTLVAGIIYSDHLLMLVVGVPARPLPCGLVAGGRRRGDVLRGGHGDSTLP